MIKKICLFTTGFGFNRQIMLNYLEDILPKEIELFLFVPKNFKNSYSVSRAKIVDTRLSKYLSFLELRKFCKKEKIDRIFNLGVIPQEGFAMLLSSLFTKTDFLIHVVGNPLYFYKLGLNKSGIKSFFEFFSFFSFAVFPQKIFFSAKDVFEIYHKYLFFSRKKIFHLPLTVDTSLFIKKDKIKSRKKLRLFDKKIVIYVGRIEYLKGSNILFEIAKLNPDIKFLLIGEINKKEIKIPEISNMEIIQKKSSEELVDYYNASDLCFFPSLIEGFGLVPREAMSCGTPTLVSDIMSLRLIKPAIKSPLNIEKMNHEIRNFFQLSDKEKTKLSLISREFIIKECDKNTLKPSYLKSILT